MCSSLILQYRVLYNLIEKRIKIGGHQTNFRSGDQNLPLPPYILRIIQYKTLWSVLFVNSFNLYYWSEVIHYNKAEKEEEKNQCLIGAHPGIDPGPLV